MHSFALWWFPYNGITTFLLWINKSKFNFVLPTDRFTFGNWIRKSILKPYSIVPIKNTLRSFYCINYIKKIEAFTQLIINPSFIILFSLFIFIHSFIYTLFVHRNRHHLSIHSSIPSPLYSSDRCLSTIH